MPKLNNQTGAASFIYTFRQLGRPIIKKIIYMARTKYAYHWCKRKNNCSQLL